MTNDSQDPLEPHGWFRWLHDQSAGRRPCRGGFAGSIPTGGPDSLDAAAVGRHSWEVGFLGRTDTLEKCWADLTPRQRGLALGGVSENDSDWEWILARLPEAELGAVETCEIACNALSAGNEPVLATVLAASSDLAGEVPRYESPIRKIGRFAETLGQLSCRCIDLVLEAALIRRSPEGVRLALLHGASPDIPVWLLERSFNEKHCALSFSIKNRMALAVSALISAGASPKGIPFCSANQPLFEAISTRQDALAIRLLKKQAALADGGEDQGRRKRIREVRRKKPRLISPGADYFFGHFDDELDWAKKSVGSLIPFVPVEEKPCFYHGDGQGGYWRTFLDVLGGDVERLKRFERHGLDSRLSAEEFLTLVDGGHYDKLLHLLAHEPEHIRASVLFRIRRRNLSFGEQGPLALRPQDDRIGDTIGFDPGPQRPCRLPDGTALYADLAAIAPAGHAPCLPGHFWLRTESSVRCRRGNETVMRRISLDWKMVSLPQNDHQLMNLLPAVRLAEGRFIRLGITLGGLSGLAGDKRLKKAVEKWMESASMQKVLAAAHGLIKDQDRANRRPPEPTLCHEELDGYPKEFWPHLVRIESGFIGMTEKSSCGDAGLMRRYRTWERMNKKEDSFVPDPRILDWEIWHEVPLELRPFLTWDDLFDRPGFRSPDGSEYEKAMSRKATQWWNEMMIPKVLAAIQASPSAGEPTGGGSPT